MARIPRLLARRARSMASIERGVPSGSEWACMSITPSRVCPYPDKPVHSNKNDSKNLTAEQAARLNTRCLCKLATTHFLTIFELGLQHFDHTALAGYLEALRCDIGD